MSTTRREFIKTVGAAIASSQIPTETAALGAAGSPRSCPAATAAQSEK